MMEAKLFLLQVVPGVLVRKPSSSFLPFPLAALHTTTATATTREENFATLTRRYPQMYAQPHSSHTTNSVGQRLSSSLE